MPHVTPSTARTASAPYNFVPLPDAVVPAVASPGGLPAHDRFYPGRRTGHVDVVLETLSPLYIRAPERVQSSVEGDASDDFRDDPKNREDFFFTRTPSEPVIPGSTLRGMIRAVFEIATRSKVERVDPSTRFMFRAVAAPGSDPLKQPYLHVIGKMAENVRAGYVTRWPDGGWAVRPAQTPGQCGVPTRDPFVRAKDDRLVELGLPTHLSFSNAGFRPGFHGATFAIDWITVESDDGPKRALAPTKFALKGGTRHAISGTLVSSGNMVETSEDSAATPRERHALVMAPDPSAPLLPIEDQAAEDYRATLTPFVREHYGDQGVLQEGHPVFYVRPAGGGRPVVYFGHTPNFRVPSRRVIDGVERAVTPRDLIPADLRDPDVVDFADAVFGYVRDGATGPGAAYAGRVSVSDAHLASGQSDVFMAALTPRVLASPKPTTFQHYLEQPTDNVAGLMHYGDELARVRGTKRYWPQGPRSLDELRETDNLVNGEVDPRSTQHTRMRPVKAGTRFQFRLHFENLSDAELGALLWTLQPDRRDDLVHSLGMGKPFGMGAVRLAYSPTLVDPARRYRILFGDGGMCTPSDGEVDSFTQAFEQAIYDGRPAADDERVRALLAMMRWPGYPAEPDGSRYLQDLARPNTRYMEIEGRRGNEYDSRPVLPSPLHFPEPSDPNLPPLAPPDRSSVSWHPVPVEERQERARSGPYKGVVPRLKRTNKGQELWIDYEHGRLKDPAANHGADDSWKGRHVAFYVEDNGDGPVPVEVLLL